MILRHLLFPLVLVFTPAVLPDTAIAQIAATAVVANATAEPEKIDSRAHPETSPKKVRDTDTVALQRYMPLIGMAFTIVLLAIIFGFAFSTDKNRHETIRRYLELNKEVPPQLLADDPDKWNKDIRKHTSDRRKGIICIASGLGTGCMLLIISGSWRGFAVGLIPVFIGVGYLILAAFGSNSSSER